MKWIQRHRPSPLTIVALAVLGVMVLAQLAGATHPRPRGATPLRVSLVPSFKQCTSPNRTHGPPLAFQSCSPPVQTSDFLTVGTPDANGAGANSVGFFQFNVKPGPASNENIIVTSSISDVRCKPGTNASVCNAANATGGPDYSGQLQADATIRVTDHFNGSGGDEAATVLDLPSPVTLLCSNTADTSIGGLCNVASLTTCPPQGCSGIRNGDRAVVEIAQMKVFDGGADGFVSTNPNDNTLFEVQGIFIP
jgi:hypothetical protein